MLYTPPNCPVNAYDKEWIEKHLFGLRKNWAAIL
jgi:hypothetical protein